MLNTLLRKAAIEVFNQGYISGVTSARLTALAYDVPALEQRLIKQKGTA